jgi:hypothetical protein
MLEIPCLWSALVFKFVVVCWPSIGCPHLLCQNRNARYVSLSFGLLSLVGLVNFLVGLEKKTNRFTAVADG